MLLPLGGTEPDPRSEAGPTSGAHHDSSLKRALGQGSSDQNGSKALKNVVAALSQGSWAGDQGTEKYCNGRALYQGSVDSHSRGAKARQGVQLWLSQGSAVAVVIRAGGSGWCDSGDGGGGAVNGWRL